MRVPLKWLGDYVPLRLAPEELAHRLTMAGLEVTAIDRTGEAWDGIVVARVVAVDPHPNADRLRLVTVEAGDGVRHRVVCGAPNVAVGQKVAFGGLGARIRDGHTGEATVLKKARIRGVDSAGMVLSEKELGLSDEHEGILVLAEDAPVGEPLASYLGDTVLEIDMKPNRADGLAILGVAREVAALTGERVTEPDLEAPREAGPIEGRARVEVADPDLCLRFTAALVEDVRIGPSPAWMRERLLAAGMRPINNIVDITNYVMLELGQPIHAFDYDTIADHHIIVRRARPGEKLTTLDGVERVFAGGELLITDPTGPIAVAGVMGGLATEVTEKTKRILLEVANFAPVSIRRTAMALKLPSEASRRFAWGLPPRLAEIASRRATKLLVELAEGRAAEGLIDVYPEEERPVVVEVTQKRIVQVLGIDPPVEKVREVLEALGFRVDGPRQGRWSVEVPYWRRDVRIADDVVEEVARMIGYDAIPTEPVAGAVPPRIRQPLRELRERVKDILVAAGMQEVITYPLTSMDALEAVVPPEELRKAEPLAVVNPLAAGQERLRTTLRGSVLAAAASNQRLGAPRLALFEAARVYLPRQGGGEDPLPYEAEHVVGVVSGRRLDRWARPTGEPVDFYDAKAYVERALERLGVAGDFVAADEYGLVPGASAAIRVAERSVGVVGRVHPRAARRFDLRQDAFLFELRLDELLPFVPARRAYRPLPRYPAVVEDLAFVVDKELPAGRLVRLLEDDPLVVSVRPFDVYEGEPVPAGKKSIAFTIQYQAPDRTLTEKEVARVRRKLVARAARELGAELRG